jgi:hypothetical protein
LAQRAELAELAKLANRTRGVAGGQQFLRLVQRTLDDLQLLFVVDRPRLAQYLFEHQRQFLARQTAAAGIQLFAVGADDEHDRNRTAFVPILRGPLAPFFAVGFDLQRDEPSRVACQRLVGLQSIQQRHTRRSRFAPGQGEDRPAGGLRQLHRLVDRLHLPPNRGRQPANQTA